MAIETDDELTRIRAQRQLEIQQSLESQAAKQAELEQESQLQAAHESALDSKIRNSLSNAARERLARIILARPDDSSNLKQVVANALDSGRFNIPMQDNELKSILSHMQSNRRESTIRRI